MKYGDEFHYTPNPESGWKKCVASIGDKVTFWSHYSFRRKLPLPTKSEEATDVYACYQSWIEAHKNDECTVGYLANLKDGIEHALQWAKAQKPSLESGTMSDEEAALYHDKWKD